MKVIFRLNAPLTFYDLKYGEVFVPRDYTPGDPVYIKVMPIGDGSRNIVRLQDGWPTSLSPDIPVIRLDEVLLKKEDEALV